MRKNITTLTNTCI